MSEPVSVAAAPPERSFLRALLRSPKGLTGLLMVGLIVGCALFAHWIAPHDPVRQTLAGRFLPPVWQEGGEWRFLLGTDPAGVSFDPP